MSYALAVYEWVKAHGPDLFLAAYTLALVGTHVFPANTLAYKLCNWLLTGPLKNKAPPPAA